jgi:UDP-galactose transporter B1
MAFSLQFVAFVMSLAFRVGLWLLDDGREQRRMAEAARRRLAAAEEEEQGETLLLEGDTGATPADKGDSPGKMVETPGSVMGWYLALSLLIAAANGAATAALNYVNMPTKVCFKSAKIVTVMLLGRLCFGKNYPARVYVYMLNVVLGLACFLLALKGGALGSSLPGVALLTLSVLADSLVPNVQQRLLTVLARPKHELVFHSNWISALLTASYAATTGELSAALFFLRRRPYLALLLLAQSVCGYLGILVYLETVRGFGPKVTAVVTSCRKLFTIGVSAVVFSHPLNYFHVLGVAAVFAGVIWDVYGDLGCSRALAPPALALMAFAVALELELDEGFQPEMRAQLIEPVRDLFRTRIL